MRRLSLGILGTILLCANVGAEEEALTISEFDLCDGRQIVAIRASLAQDVYSIVTLDGQQVSVRAVDIQAKADKQLPVTSLPSNLREALAGNGSDVSAEVNTALQELAAARTRQKDAALVAEQAAADLVRVQAELNAARGTPPPFVHPGGRFGAQTTCPYCAAGLPCPTAQRSGTDFEDRAMREMAKQEAEATAARFDEQFKQLTDKDADAKQRLEAAKNRVQAALTHAVDLLLTATVAPAR